MTAGLVRDVGRTAILVDLHVDRVFEVVDRAVLLSRGPIALNLTAAAARADRDVLTDAYLTSRK